MPKLLCAHPLCGREVIISSPYKRDSVYDGKKWWHIDCFCNTFPNKKIETWLNKTEKYLNDKLYTEMLEQYIKSHYNISLIPSSVKKRIEKLSSGTDDEFKEKINQSQILDMLKYYSSELEQRALYRRNSGIEGMMATSSGVACFNYDLKYILSKYDEYISAITQSKLSHSNSESLLNLVSPDMTPVYKKQERILEETGQAEFQRIMDLYWDDQD